METGWRKGKRKELWKGKERVLWKVGLGYKLGFVFDEFVERRLNEVCLCVVCKERSSRVCGCVDCCGAMWRGWRLWY